MAADFFKLHGQVTGGMFPNEVAFAVTDHRGRQFIVIVPTSLVDAQDRIRVRRVGQAEGLSLVKMPGESLSASDALYVADSQLIPA